MRYLKYFQGCFSGIPYMFLWLFFGVICAFQIFFSRVFRVFQQVPRNNFQQLFVFFGVVFQCSVGWFSGPFSVFLEVFFQMFLQCIFGCNSSLFQSVYRTFLERFKVKNSLGRMFLRVFLMSLWRCFLRFFFNISWGFSCVSWVFLLCFSCVSQVFLWCFSDFKNRRFQP